MWTALVAVGVLVATPAAIALLAVAGALASHVYKMLSQRWIYRHIPGPTPHILMGNVRDIMKAGGNHVFMAKQAEKYGPVFKVFILSRMFVVIVDPDAARTVLYKFTNRPTLMVPSLHLLRGDCTPLDQRSILQARDSFWRMLRNAWQPAFAPGTLTRYVDLMTASAGQLCDMLHAKAGPAPAKANGAAAGTGGEYVDMHELLCRMTMEVVGTCAYGVHFNALTAGNEPPVPTAADLKAVPGEDLTLSKLGPRLVHATRDFFATSSFAGSSRWGLPVTLMPSLKPVVLELAHRFPDMPLIRAVTSRQTILRTSKMLIDDWRSRRAVNDVDGHAGAPPVAPRGSAMEGVQPGSFLSLMLNAQRNGEAPLDDITITAQTNLFLLAGTETTANTLAFAVGLLAQHPDALNRLIEELDAHGLGKPVSIEDKLPWTDAVISEVMRFIPTAAAVTRDMDKPGSSMTLCGYHIPGPVQFFVPIYAMHRDPAVWPQANEFLPERWLPENEAKLGPRNPNAYLPFGGGTRMCPGWKFARQEMRIALAALYKQFNFELEPGQLPLKITAGITMSPTSLRVKATPRVPGVVGSVAAA